MWGLHAPTFYREYTMRTVEEFIEELKTKDKMYQWPIERFEKKKPERDELHKEFPYVITYKDYYPNLDDIENWCRDKFGDEHGKCKWSGCEWSFDSWHIGTGLRKELDELLYNEVRRPKNDDSPEYKLWDEYHDLIMDAHFDMIKNDLYDKPGEHCHMGTWRSFFIIKTGYDYGYEDYCFKNEEDAVYFKLMWDEIASKK